MHNDKMIAYPGNAGVPACEFSGRPAQRALRHHLEFNKNYIHERN